MAFKSALTKFQNNSWKTPNVYNTSYREKEVVQTPNKDAMSQMTSFGTRENAEFLTRENSVKKSINTSLSKDEKINSSKIEKIHSPINLEFDLLQYKKHERDDSSSDSSLQITSSNNSVSSTSTRLTTPVDDLDSKFDFMKAGLSSSNNGTKTLFNDSQTNDYEAFIIKLEKQQQQHREELEQLRKEHKTQLDKTKLDYEKSINDHKQEFEKTIQELKNNIENMKKENSSEMEKIKNEFSVRYESQKEELTGLHDAEKNKLIAGLKTMKRYKEKAEDDLMESKNNFQVEIRSIRKECEKEKEILRREHAGQLDSMIRGETKITFAQIKDQQDRRIIEGERKLRDQIDGLTRELGEKKAAENSWVKYKREKESALLDLKTQLYSLETANKQKDAQIVELQKECARSLQEIKDLNRDKEKTSNMIKEFQQKTEEVIKGQVNARIKVERESEQIIETLREQLSDTNKELSNLRIQLSNLELDYNEAKEQCEDLESLIKDKYEIINRLQLQIESNELELKDVQNFKELKEQQEKEHEQSLASLRKKLETNHQKELQELRDQLEKEYEIKINELTDQNSRIRQNSLQNSKTVKELEEATHRLANAESSYKELNEKHQQLVNKNQQLSKEIAAIRSKVEDLETNNLDLKENNRMITLEKEKMGEELKKANDKMKRLQDESSIVNNKLIELENERDKQASTVSTVKTYWEKNYKDLQVQLQVMESQRDKSDNELTKIKSEYNEKVKAFEELTNNVDVIEKQKVSLSKLLEDHQNSMQTFMKENAAEREALHQKEADLISNYELELREKDSKLEELHEKLDYTRKHSEELEELLQEAKEAETKKLELSQKLEAALQECVNKDIEISNLEMFKKQSQARIDSLESSTSRLTNKLRAVETDAEQAKRNADAKINDLHNRLKDSMTEIEDLHNQVSDLKHNLIEKEAMVLSHSRSSSRDGPKSPIIDTSKITSLMMQVEEYKVTHQNLEAQIATLTQQLQELHQEKNSTITAFEHSITQAEKTVDGLRDKIKTMAIEHEEETKQILKNHQLSIQELNKQKEDEIVKITEFTQSKLAALEKRQRNITNTADRSNNDDTKKVNILEKRLSELENSLRESRSECEKLNEKIMQVQQRYADSISEKDKVVKERNDMEKKIKSMDAELKVVSLFLTLIKYLFKIFIY
jgi:chromosome segregation ATPase